MRRALWFFLGVAVCLSLAATSEIRLNDSDYNSTEIERCIAIVAGANDLGTDPNDASFQSGIGTLEDDSKTYVKYSDTGIPAGFCTTGGTAQDHLETVCAKEDPDLVPNMVAITGDKVTFVCVDPSAMTDFVVFGVVDCP